MKSFFVKLFTVGLLILGVCLIKPIWGLVLLHKSYRYPKITAHFKKSKIDSKRKILIIGCSNLQHNIDYRKVQDSFRTSIDFLDFSGGQNATYLKYLVSLNLTNNYSDIILYLPYHLYRNDRFITQDAFSYKNFISYSYIENVIIDKPVFLFFNWKKVYDTVRLKRKPTFAIKDSIPNFDRYIDSLYNPWTSYSNCTQKFIHRKHVIRPVFFTNEDQNYLNSIKKEDQHIYILFTPIPDIRENRSYISKLDNISKTFDKIKLLNRPFVMDSSYFFDQWYHLNKCGNEIETEKMIKAIKKII